MRFRLPRLQFSLRTLVIVVVIVAALASWHGSRYARYKARLVARQQAEERGLVFYHRLEAEYFLGSKLSAVAQLSLAERWDLLCFGHETSKFPACEMNMHNYVVNPKPYENKNHAEILQLHPEIEIVRINMITEKYRDQFQRIAGLIGLDQRELRSRGLFRALNDFTTLPNLREFIVSEPAMIEDDWVAALPESCKLTRLDGPISLSPKAALELLRKAPHLNYFRLNQAALNETVRETLQDRFTITLANPDHYIVQKKP